MSVLRLPARAFIYLPVCLFLRCFILFFDIGKFLLLMLLSRLFGTSPKKVYRKQEPAFTRQKKGDKKIFCFPRASGKALLDRLKTFRPNTGDQFRQSSLGATSDRILKTFPAPAGLTAFTFFAGPKRDLKKLSEP